MVTRRSILKSLGLSAFSLAALSASGKTIGDKLDYEFPIEDDPQFWSKIRSQFTLSKDSIFFNCSTVGVMPRPVVEKMIEHSRYLATNVADWAYKDDNKEQFISGYNSLIPIRTKVANLLNCKVEEIAMTDNVTNSMSYIANGITLRTGDEILTTDQEHGGGKSSWLVKEKRFGVVVKTVAIPKPAQSSAEVFDVIVKAFTPNTKVLMLSHIISSAGAILPVKQLCAEAKKRGIFTVLDGAQTIGHIKVDLKDIDCDAYVGCFHKWMGAPTGTGFLFVKADRMKELWTTVASSRWDNHEDEGFRFTQRGTGNFSVLLGLEAALDFHMRIGPEKVYERIKFLGDRLRAGLRENKKVKLFSPAEDAMCSGITLYNIDGFTGTQLQDSFWEKARMRPRSQGDKFGVRHSTHIFNSVDEIDKAIKIVKDFSV